MIFELWMEGVKIILKWLSFGIPLVIAMILVTYWAIFLVDILWCLISKEEELYITQYFLPSKLYKKVRKILFCK